MSVFGDIAVSKRLIADVRHKSLLSVLLFNEVFSRFANNVSAEEHLPITDEGVDLHHVFGTEDFKCQPQASTDETPRSRRLNDDQVSARCLKDNSRRCVVFSGMLGVVNFKFVLPHFLEFRSVFWASPFEGGNLSVNGLGFEDGHALTKRSQEIPTGKRAVAKHIVEDASALQVTTPEPSAVRTAVLFSATGKVGFTCNGSATTPNEFLTARNRWSVDLVLQVAVRDLRFRHRLVNLFGFSQVASKGLFHSETFQFRAPAFNLIGDRFN